VTPDGGILVLNAGSSSLRFALYKRGQGGLVRVDCGRSEDEAFDAAAALAWAETRIDRLEAVGHRVVHGGARFAKPQIVTASVLKALEKLVPLAPLHQPRNLAGVRAIAASRPRLVQAACFDTAFHHGHAPEVDRLPLPRALERRGLRRYGFHGLSYEYLSRRLAELDPVLAAGRVILAHLGAGASLCATRNGRSVDTTMGFSTLDGLVMATRPGALDPGVVLHLIRQEGMTPEAVETMLYEGSGLLGMSGLSGDMRTLLASHSASARAALDVYVLQIVRQVGALAAVLGGVDGLVFSGGVGEKAVEIRARVCERLAWLGLALDPAANAAHADLISAPGNLPVRVIPTDEERMIADQTLALVSARGG
jgi:acetate kinase